MSTGVMITLIICGTIIAIFLIALIGSAITAKKKTKTVESFMKRLFEEDDE